ncbi:MAG: hypothetical protein E7624_01215 [Ruminococcaceae bacterium]|nr:hypothetical protein [Oscillospiraceae bacterium]
MNKQEALHLLRTTPLFWSRLGFCYDPPLYHENGERIVFNDTYSEAKTHADFTAAGVTLHTCILDSGWVGIDTYDYTLCDRVLHEVFEVGKAAYYIPRIKLNVPQDWCAAYPEEVCVYEDGPRDAEGVRALVDTLKQDILGYDSEVGYYNANGWQDTRPNVGGVIARQSFSSKKWLADAGEALRRLIEHLENGPYGDRILAYHIAYGTCGETIVWGRQSGRFPDYGVSNRRHFLAWGLKKYGSEAALRAVWGDCGEESVPPSVVREPKNEKGEELWRDPKVGQWAVDYDLFVNECSIDAMEHFGKIVKEMTDDKPVGVFYGYIMYVERSGCASHLGGYERVLNSPYIDFFAAPKPYRRSEPGEPGGEMCPVTSVNARKLWVDECDIRTHLATGDAKHSHSRGKSDTESMLLRELCKNLAHNSGLWFMDLGGNWYDDAEIMAFVQKLNGVASKVCEKKHRFASSVVAIVDEQSMLWTPPARNRRMEHLWRNFNLCGAPCNLILSQDVERSDLSQTELVILLTPYCLDKPYIEKLRGLLPSNAKILFVGESAALQGVKYMEYPDDEFIDLRLPAQQGIAPLCRDYKGVCTVGVLESGDILAASTCLDVNAASKIFTYAGVTRTAPIECTVYRDNRLVGFFPREDVCFVPDIPEGVTWRDVLTGEEISRGAELAIPARGARAFYIE